MTKRFIRKKHNNDLLEILSCLLPFREELQGLVVESTYNWYWLAHVLRLGLLPEGYICPKEERSVRDLLRKRSQLVRQKTANVLSIINLFTRNTGEAINLRQVEKLTAEELLNRFGDESLCLAVASNLEVFRCLETQIKLLEQAILE